MSGFTKEGQHVEDLAKATRRELMEWIGRTKSALVRAEWQVSHRELRLENARLYFEKCVKEVEDDAAEAPQVIERLTRRLADLEAQLAKAEQPRVAGPRAPQAPDPQRVARVNGLIVRIAKGGEDAKVAAGELKEMM